MNSRENEFKQRASAYAEQEKKAANGLFWQFDVRDAMEETISGGRNEKNPRPSINGYMFGNAKALSAILQLNGDQTTAQVYNRKADSIKQLSQQMLWHPQHLFFEVKKEMKRRYPKHSWPDEPLQAEAVRGVKRK